MMIQKDKNPHSHAFATSARVKILTSAGGCYDGATGAVIEKLDAGLLPYPAGLEPEIPHFYRIRTDRPVNIGGGCLSQEDVHPSGQVFSEDTCLKNYWDSGCRPKAQKESST